jgi:hypothetical protein
MLAIMATTRTVLCRKLLQVRYANPHTKVVFIALSNSMGSLLINLFYNNALSLLGINSKLNTSTGFRRGLYN